MLRAGAMFGRSWIGARSVGRKSETWMPMSVRAGVREWSGKGGKRQNESRVEALRQSRNRAVKSTPGSGGSGGKQLFKSKSGVGGGGERLTGGKATESGGARRGDRVLDGGAVALFEVDKRKLFFGFGLVGVIQLVMLSVIGNVFFTLAKMKREMEASQALKDELSELITLPPTPERLERTRVLRKTLEVEGGVQFGFVDLVTSFSSSELISSFLPIAFAVVVFMIIRGYGLRYVRRVDLLAGGKQLRLGTYDLFGRARSETVTIKELRPNFDKGTGNEQWLGFKGPNQRWLSYLVDQKSGAVHDRTTLLSVLSGKEAGSTKYDVVARQLEELFKQ